MKSIPFFLAFLYSVQAISQHTVVANVTMFTIAAPQLNTKKKIWVYLPENYSRTNKRYPVIYMHDGQNLFDAAISYSGEWRVDETLNNAKAEVIVVGIEHGGEKRVEELTPYKNPQQSSGRGDLYLDFIIETLKPHIDVVYRTLVTSDNTFIMGSSLGGLLSFYAAMKYPDVFGKAGVLSPSFWFSEDIYTLVDKMGTLPNVKLYFATGGEEGESTIQNHQRMVLLLEKKGMPKTNFQSSIVKGKEHNELFWSGIFPEAYQWLLKTDRVKR